MLLNAKLNNPAQKILWEEAVHTCEHAVKIMSRTGSTTSPFKNFYGKEPKIIGLFSEFGRIGYVTKRKNTKKQMTEKNSRQSWLDMKKVIKGTRKSCTTLKPR